MDCGTIVDASDRSGYDDLSRGYRQFRNATLRMPASPNDRRSGAHRVVPR